MLVVHPLFLVPFARDLYLMRPVFISACVVLKPIALQKKAALLRNRLREIKIFVLLSFISSRF